MSRIGIVLWSFLWFNNAIYGQSDSVYINVYDNQGPLPSAIVQLQGKDNAWVTNSKGIVAIPSIDSNEMIIEVSMIGFETHIQTLSKPFPPLLKIILKEKTEYMDEVVITGTMRETRRSQSIVPVDILSKGFLTKNPGSSFYDIFQLVNGVRPQMQCNVCNTGSIRINGMDGPYTLFLIDGMPIVSGLSTVYGLMGIPNNIIERIEIVKGPAGALYGSEAMGGVINVITKDPGKVPNLNVDFNATSYQEFNLDLSKKYSIGKKLQGFISGNVFNFQNRVDFNNDNFTDLALIKRYSVFNRWKWNRNNNRVADFAVRYLNENRTGGQLSFQPFQRGNDSIYGEDIITKRIEVLANYDIPFGNENILFNFSGNRHLQDSYYGNTKYEADQSIIFGQFIWKKNLGSRHNFLAGVGQRYTYYDDNTSVTQSIDLLTNKPQNHFLTGGFLQDEIMISRNWNSLFGFRYDYSNIHGSITSPRFGIRYKRDKINSFRFNAGSGFRVVNVFSEDHAALIGGRVVEFKEELNPERSINTNFNYSRFQNTNFGFINIEWSVFYVYFNNRIFGDYLTDSEKVIYRNLDGFADNMGTSLDLDFNFKNGLKIDLGGTFLQSLLYEQGNKQEFIQNPPFSGTYGISYTWEKHKISFDLNGFVNGPMLMPTFENDFRPSRSPWYNITNIQATKVFGNGISIYGGIRNLFNYFPSINPIMRPFDPFDKNAGDPVSNPNEYTFDPSYNYAPLQTLRGFVGIRYELK
jgi:outer membrane receptor for ferrienterochelin and colicins